MQKYKTGQLLWITVSSTRSYGLRVDNTGKQNCYPTESPNWAGPAFPNRIDCTRAQIWMAGVRLDGAAVKSGQDVSWPGFWLPFQDLQTNNHLAQWAQRQYSGPCTQPSDCTKTGECCENGGCTSCAPTQPPPQPTCGIDSNCKTGTCCVSGSCVPCASKPDGGTPTTGCQTCLDCKGQACVDGVCGACTNSADCCAPLICKSGKCVINLQ